MNVIGLLVVNWMHVPSGVEVELTDHPNSKYGLLNWDGPRGSESVQLEPGDFEFLIQVIK